MIAVIVMIFCMLLVTVGAYLFLTRPQEGDECEGKDENGNYEIDDKGKCVLDSCASGYYKSGKECLVDQSGEDCVPEGLKDPEGTYITNQMGGCELTCNTGYVKSGDDCEPETATYTIPTDAASQDQCYGARYTDLRIAFGEDGASLRDHYTNNVVNGS